MAYVFGDLTVARKIAQQAIRDLQQQQLNLTVALQQADAEKIYYHAHSINGVACVMKCAQLSTAARALEVCVNGQHPGDTNQLASDLALHVQNTIKALADFTAASGDDPSGSENSMIGK